MKNVPLLAALFLLGLSCNAYASDSVPVVSLPPMEQNFPWYVHFGPIGVVFDSSTKISIGGQRFPGAGAEASNNATGGVEIGYRFTDNIGVSLTAGYPPKSTLTGTGALAGIKLGKITYGPAILTVHYQLTSFGPRFKPYIGAGVNYSWVMGEEDGAVQNLRVASAFGSVLQAGIESDFSRRWGMFVDVKKIFLSTTGKGNVGGAPASAKLDLDPLILMGGITYRF